MNRLLYNQYKLKKASILQNATYPQVERTLYHGTSEGSVKEICVHGFNRSFCGKNGTFFSRCALFLANAEYISDSRASLHSHRLRSRRVLRRQLGPVDQGPVFPAKPGRVQVHFRVQGPDGRLHQRVPLHEDGPAQGDRRHPAPIRQRHGQHHPANNICHFQRHSGVPRVSHHLSENRPKLCFVLIIFCLVVGGGSAVKTLMHGVSSSALFFCLFLKNLLWI